jgi:ATP-binding cassette subfamily D (ALD) protein 3
MGLDDAVYNAVTAIPRHRRKFALVLVLTLSSLYVLNKRRREALRSVERKTAPLPESAPLDDNNSGKGSKKRVGVDAQFVAQLRRLLPICIPGLASKEFALLASLAVVLIARTWLDIWFSAFNGVVVKSIVTRDWPLFFKNAFLLFGFMMWPMSVVNNSLKLLISKLALAFRTRLTRYAHSQYLQGITFYQVANLDTRIQNADQLLTQVYLPARMLILMMPMSM